MMPLFITRVANESKKFIDLVLLHSTRVCRITYPENTSRFAKFLICLNKMRHVKKCSICTFTSEKKAHCSRIDVRIDGNIGRRPIEFDNEVFLRRPIWQNPVWRVWMGFLFLLWSRQLCRSEE